MMFEKIDVNGDKEHPLYTYLKVQVIILLLYDLKKKPYTPSNVHVVLILVFAIYIGTLNLQWHLWCLLHWNTKSTMASLVFITLEH
jgi:glutathione peroxidase-family protein